MSIYVKGLKMTLEEKIEFINRYDDLTKKQDQCLGEESLEIENWLDENEELYEECLHDVSHKNLN